MVCFSRSRLKYLKKFWLKYLKWLNPNFYFGIFMTPKACELFGLDAHFFAQSADKPSFADYTMEPLVSTFFTFLLVGRGKVADW